MGQATPKTGTGSGHAATRQPELGQARTAEGDLDLSAIYVIHHALRRDLRDFAGAIPRTPLDDIESWAALADRWSQFATALHHHTRVEDRGIWPEIARELPAGDPAHQVLDAMAAEHLAIDRLVQQVALDFAPLGSQAEELTRAQLFDDFQSADRAIRAHLHREESEALQLMQAHLSADRWQAAQSDAGKEYGLADLRFAVPWSAHEIPADQFAVAFAHGGVLIRMLLALTRRGFQRRHARAFRYLRYAG